MKVISKAGMINYRDVRADPPGPIPCLVWGNGELTWYADPFGDRRILLGRVGRSPAQVSPGGTMRWWGDDGNMTNEVLP